MGDVYYWFSLNPLVPGTPLTGAQWLAKDPAAVIGNGEADKSAWHKSLLCPSCPTNQRVMGNLLPGQHRHEPLPLLAETDLDGSL